MQGCQNLGDDRLHLKLKRIMYPEKCGYRSETGGLMERLRELSVGKSKGHLLQTHSTRLIVPKKKKKVRDYHKSYYRPDNLCLIITGNVDKGELLTVLEHIDESILRKGPLSKMQRPWVSTGDFPNLKKSIEETVIFADEDESMGTVLLAWNGPVYNVKMKRNLNQEVFFKKEYLLFRIL